jgi:hypothetical protein
LTDLEEYANSTNFKKENLKGNIIDQLRIKVRTEARKIHSDLLININVNNASNVSNDAFHSNDNEDDDDCENGNYFSQDLKYSHEHEKEKKNSTTADPHSEKLFIFANRYFVYYCQCYDYNTNTKFILY